jgi:hypothetical protein
MIGIVVYIIAVGRVTFFLLCAQWTCNQKICHGLVQNQGRKIVQGRLSRKHSCLEFGQCYPSAVVQRPTAATGISQVFGCNCTMLHPMWKKHSFVGRGYSVESSGSHHVGNVTCQSPQWPQPGWPTYAPTPTAGQSLFARDTNASFFTRCTSHQCALSRRQQLHSSWRCPCPQLPRECARDLVGVSCTDPSPFIAILLVVLLTLICRIRLISITTLYLIALGPGCGAFSQDQHLYHHKCCRHDY